MSDATPMTQQEARALLDRVQAENPAQLLAASNTIAIEALGAVESLAGKVDIVARAMAQLAPLLASLRAQAQPAAEAPAMEPAAAPAVVDAAPAPAVTVPAPAAQAPPVVKKGRSGPPGAPSPAAPNGTAPPMTPSPPEGSEPHAGAKS